MTTKTVYDMLVQLEQRVKHLEDTDSRNLRIAELECEVYRLQQEQYRLKSAMFKIELERYFENKKTKK